MWLESTNGIKKASCQGHRGPHPGNKLLRPGKSISWGIRTALNQHCPRRDKKPRVQPVPCSSGYSWECPEHTPALLGLSSPCWCQMAAERHLELNPLSQEHPAARKCRYTPARAAPVRLLVEAKASSAFLRRSRIWTQKHARRRMGKAEAQRGGGARGRKEATSF